MNIEQPLTNMTWGDLRAFVALGGQIADDEPVNYEVDEYDQSVRGLSIWGIPSPLLAEGSRTEARRHGA